MINQQENEALTESHHRHQCEVYDDLSTLMQIFKKLLLSIEEIAFTHLKQIDPETPREKLRTLSKTLQALIRKYSQQSEQFRIEARTFQRFVCRLFETIEICQLKYRGSSTHEGNFAASKLGSIEATLKDSECVHDFVKLARTIKYIVEKLASFDHAGPARGENSQESPNGKRALLDKMDAKMIKLRNMKRPRPERREAERCSSDEDDEYDEVRSVSFTEKKTNYLPISHSISSDLQKRFELYKGLDLDFSNFKASYFSAKSNTDLFYREYLERNVLNSRIIKGYSDDFMLFQKKRLRNHRRIVNRHNEASLEGDVSVNVSQGQNWTKSEQPSLKDDRSDKKKVAVIHNENFEQEGDYRDKAKTSYKMNNIYLTFGKKPKQGKKERHYPNITPNILKNKHQFQNLYLNNSFCPKNELSVTQSIDFEQLKVVTAIKGINGSQRIKTSPDRGVNESQKVKAEYRQAMMKALKQAEHVPFRAVNKRRYLELDCTSKKEISLNKVILTGSTNARHIKLGRINDQKGSNILF